MLLFPQIPEAKSIIEGIILELHQWYVAYQSAIKSSILHYMLFKVALPPIPDILSCD